MSGVVWTSDMVAELARLRAERNSAAQIAEALSARFGVELTRNAVVGKCHRLNLAAAPPPPPAPAERLKGPPAQSRAGAPRPPKWTDDEIAVLKRMRAEGQSNAAIAAALGRSQGAVEHRVNLLGLARPVVKHLGLEHWPARPAPVAPSAPRPVASPPPPPAPTPAPVPALPAASRFGWGAEPLTCGEVLEDGAVCASPPKRGSVWCPACAARFKVAPSQPRLTPPRDSTRVSARRVFRADGWERWL